MTPRPKISETADIWEDPNLPSQKASAINKARMKTYGTPVPNMEVFAALISPVLGIEVSPQQAAMILVQLKVMREVQANYPLDYPDNLEDICGWANVLYQTKEAQRD